MYELSIDRLSLLHALHAAMIADRRMGKPQYGTIKLQDTGAYLEANDAEIWLRLKLSSDPNTFDRDGAYRVYMPHLLGIVSNSNAKVFDVSITKDMRISGDESSFRLPLTSADDVATIADSIGDEPIARMDVNAGDLRRAIRRTAFAVATEAQESSSLIMQSTLWESDELTFRLVSTDGRRLALAEFPCTRFLPKFLPKAAALVPPRFMAIASKLLAGFPAESNVQVDFYSQIVAIYVSQGAAIVGAQTEGKFPPYMEVIGRKWPETVRLSAGRLRHSVRQSQILQDKEQRCTLILQPGKLSVESASSFGQSEAHIPVEYQGKKISIELDPKAIGEALKTMDYDEEFDLQLKDAKTTASIRQPNFMFVAVPYGV